MSIACSEIIWWRSLLTKLGFYQVKPTALHTDNIIVIQFVANLIYHEMREAHRDSLSLHLEGL